jgi:hypothetical protein
MEFESDAGVFFCVGRLCFLSLTFSSFSLLGINGASFLSLFGIWILSVVSCVVVSVLLLFRVCVSCFWYIFFDLV